MDNGNVAEFELSDIEVDTVGLVTAGAIGEDFFLMKKDGDNMDDELKDVEVIDPDSKGFWDKMKTLLKGTMAEKSEAEPEPEPEATEEVVVTEEKAVTAPIADKEVEIVEEVKTEMAETEVTKVEQPEVNITDAISQVQKALQEQYDAQLKDLRERLEKAEAETTRTKEETAEKEMIQKARGFGALPVRYDELGKKLYQLSKSVSTEQFDWLMSLLGAVDKQLGAAGILSEFGTSKAPEELAIEDKADKIAKDKNIPYADALLELSEEEQEQLLARK